MSFDQYYFHSGPWTAQSSDWVYRTAVGRGGAVGKVNTQGHSRGWSSQRPSGMAPDSTDRQALPRGRGENKKKTQPRPLLQNSIVINKGKIHEPSSPPHHQLARKNTGSFSNRTKHLSNNGTGRYSSIGPLRKAAPYKFSVVASVSRLQNLPIRPRQDNPNSVSTQFLGWTECTLRKTKG